MRILWSTVLIALLAEGVARSQAVFPVEGSGERRSRSYDVLHYAIRVKLDEQQKSLDGEVTTRLVPLLPRLETVEFDAEQLEVRSVRLASGRSLNFALEPKKLVITLDRAYSYRDTLTVTTVYSCHPEKGAYFVRPDSGYPRRPWQIWTQGEDMDNHFWFPCYDYPNDLATSEVTLTVNKKFVAVSNGRLLSVREDSKKGTKTFRWACAKPFASYLIMFAVGEYAILRDRVGALPLEYYVYPDQLEDARVCFNETGEMVRFFGRRIGFSYPWEKYAQVLAHDFVAGGMENVSATTLMDDIAVYDARARLDDSPVSLIAHELAHQWWGDVVTCKDWTHLWLNESFASYFDPLYFEYSRGQDEFDYIMYLDQRVGINVDKQLGRKPIVSVGSYSGNVYPRGASVLHMLRFVLGDSLFWRGLHHYIEKYQFSPVETHDLEEALEEATGQNLTWFFAQWVYKAGYPVFHVSHSWDDSAKAVRLHVQQTQSRDSLTGVFRTPVDVEFWLPSGRSTHRVNVLALDTVYVIPLSEKPRMVIFDKGNWILKELVFDKTPEEWAFQAEHASSPVDRIRALERLAGVPDSLQMRLLAALALKDPFWAVRSKAVYQLGALADSSASLKSSIEHVLLAALKDGKSDVRVYAVDRLGSFPDLNVNLALRNALTDSSYNVVAAALWSLARVDSAGAPALLSAYLSVPSHQNTVANSALRALSEIDSLRSLASAFELVRYGQPRWTRITALQVFGRHGRGRSDVLQCCMGLLSDGDRVVREEAVRILGVIGDVSTLSVLENVATGSERQLADRARSAMERIRKRLAAPDAKSK